MDKKKNLTEQEFRTLVSFLIDENDRTIALVKKQLKTALKNNPQFHPLLRSIADKRLNAETEKFLEECRLEELETALVELKKQGPGLDLELGVYLVAATEYPVLKREDISPLLDFMAEDVGRAIDAEEASVAQAMDLLRHHLFQRQGFVGNERHYYDPDNSYINKVLERRTGIPLTLSCVYLFSAWRLDMPAHGIGLPGHFIVGHELPTGVVYIDAFKKGKILSEQECALMVRRQGLEFREEYLSFATNRQVLERMILNLVQIYTDQKNDHKTQLLSRWHQILQA